MAATNLHGPAAGTASGLPRTCSASTGPWTPKSDRTKKLAARAARYQKAGLPNSEIARELGYSRRHIERLLAAHRALTQQQELEATP